MDWNLDYGELSKDKDFVEKFDNLKGNLMDLQNVLDKLLPLKEHYDKLTLPAQIELDLVLVFTLNSLHWIHLRIQGIDPAKHPIKDELQRIRAVMVKWQEVKDKEKRPTVDIEAAKRFVRSGLYDPYKAKARQTQKQNKKTIFKDDEA